MIEKTAGFLKHTLFMMLIITVLAGMCVNCIFAKNSISEEDSRVEIDKITITSISANVFSAGFAEYSIGKRTEFVDLKGRVINLKQIAVPCEASVSFVTYGDVKKALEVVITKFSRAITRNPE